MGKRQIKILFVNPGRGIYDMPPLGVCYLSSYLKKYGPSRYTVALADEYSGHNPVKFAKEFEPDIIGFTSATAQYHRAMQLGSRIRRFSKAPLVIGGLHPTAMPRQVIRDGVFDIAVLSEAERSFIHLVEALADSGFAPRPDSLKEVPGIAFHDNGEVVVTPPPAFIEDLDTIPFPDRSILDLGHYLRPNAAIRSLITRNTTIMTSRGCPFKCIYCLSVHRRRLRAHSAEYVIEEMEQLVRDFGLEGLCIIDDTFIFDRERAAQIAQLMLSKGIAGRIKWPCYGRANIVSRCEDDLLRLLSQAGMVQMEFGLESGSQRVLSFLKGKGVTVSDNQETLDKLQKLGIRALATFMTGIPTETPEEVDMTLDFVHKNFNKMVYFEMLYLVPYPGTKVWEMYQMDQIVSKRLWRVFKIGLNRKFPVDCNFTRNIDYDAADRAVDEVLSLMAKKLSLKYNLRFLRDRLRIAPLDTIKKVAAHYLRI